MSAPNTSNIVDSHTKSWADFPNPDELGISKLKKIRRKKAFNAWEAEKELVEAEKEEQQKRKEAERRERERLGRGREEGEARRKAEEEAQKKAEEEARKRAKEVARKKAEEKAREDARRAKEAEKGKGKATAPSEASEAGPSGSWVPGFKTPCYNCRRKDYNCIREKTAKIHASGVQTIKSRKDKERRNGQRVSGRIGLIGDPFEEGIRTEELILMTTEKGKPSKSCMNCLESKIQCSRDPTLGPSWKAPWKPVDPNYIDVNEEEDNEGKVPEKKKTTSKAASEGTWRAVKGDLGPQIERLTAVLK
ncbi:hypothetical protein K474DRAFT_1761747 [Panus rudis PR-1116 ss-1]|nr:hypothetical protein K474DRAFT_1761747 [Panus rudis PR-1116 ss-1]